MGYPAPRSHIYQRMTGLGMTHGEVTSIELLVVACFLCRRSLHPGRSCGADRLGDFRDRRDRLRRSLGMG